MLYIFLKREQKREGSFFRLGKNNEATSDLGLWSRTGKKYLNVPYRYPKWANIYISNPHPKSPLITS